MPYCAQIALISCLSLAIGQNLALAKDAVQPAERVCPAQVGDGLKAIANQPQFQPARWGIAVQTLATGTTLYAQDAEKYFLPASTAKLLTTAASLQRLGADFRWRTPVYGQGSAPSLSRLTIAGQGDPSLSQAQLNALAQQLHQQGVRQVQTLVLDDSYFQGDRINPTWEWEDTQSGDGAPVNSLIVDQNQFEILARPQTVGQPLKLAFVDPRLSQQWQLANTTRTVNADQPEVITIERQASLIKIGGQLQTGAAPETIGVAVVNPAENFAQHFRQALSAQQIQVGQTVIQTQPTPVAGPELAAIASPPLAEILKEINQNSNNLYAEALLKRLGMTSAQPSDQPTAAGLTVLAATLSALGINPQFYQLADGSGLSRRNLVSPISLVQLLRAMQQTPSAKVFRDSLAIAGTNGTLAGRLPNLSLQVKTGSLTGVVALSGYLKPPQYEPVVFSLIVNQSGQPNPIVRQAIDQMVLLLNRLGPC
ncbi:MAG: D-alanyl-D-alanine carboxypeptidase/D-alanyl-D-alanine-endopeptidase [Aphanocapsa sp. GSE-SYN-MK-11-07L]|jgi:D-alanyl-D-alanine carboxypeptidase/D-alanyl-D-alanine-endopeptidase (penicillin-binding protein 4)|nr:D-alanyl-D-alanine carboxypeptidase/D-alanyl-D-alanine-endopeptidase [Aphanocapsa sp. GSE-SYN-MK-11-07L]